MNARSGRRAGVSGTREAILDAARNQFAEHGYDGATIRSIAGAAGVDPALVHHFHGTKEKLFVAAMELPVVPGEVLAQLSGVDPDELGEALVRAVLGIWERDEVRSFAVGLLRSALNNEAAATMLREFVTTTLLARIAGVVGGGADAGLRAALAGSQVIGLAVARYVVRIEPLASASIDELAAGYGPALQHYLTGNLGAASTAHPPLAPVLRSVRAPR